MLTREQRRAIVAEIVGDDPGALDEVEWIVATRRAWPAEPARLTAAERRKGRARVQAFKARLSDLRAAVASLDPDMIERLHRPRYRGGELPLGAMEMLEEAAGQALAMGRQRYWPKERRPPHPDGLLWMVAQLALVYRGATGKRPGLANDPATGSPRSTPFVRFAEAATGGELPVRVLREVCGLMNETGSAEVRLKRGLRLQEILGKEPLQVWWRLDDSKNASD